MILILRGHIRNSFNNLKLYNLINQIYETDQNIKIYIHTWNIFSNNISWREIESNNTPVTEEIIYNYFNDLKHLIKHIIIINFAILFLFICVFFKCHFGLTVK